MSHPSYRELARSMRVLVETQQALLDSEKPDHPAERETSGTTQLNQAMQMLRTLLELHPQAAAIADAKGTWVCANRAFGSLFGVSTSVRSLPDTWRTQFSGPLRTDDAGLWSSLSAERPGVDLRFAMCKQDGTQASFLAHGALLERKLDGNYLIGWTFFEVGSQPQETSSSPGIGDGDHPPSSSSPPRRLLRNAMLSRICGTMSSHPRDFTETASGTISLSASLGAGYARQAPNEQSSQKSSTGPRHILHRDCLHCVEKSREALKLLMSHTSEQRRDLEKRIAENYLVTVLPLIEHLKSMNLPPSQAYLLETLEFNLRHINSVFRIQVPTSATRLSDREIEICQLIRAGKDSRQIADALGLKLQTVMVHRKHIRRKLGLRNKGVRLSVFLQRKLDTMY